MNKKAFSLIELSIVILIIGIIVAGITQASSLVRKMRISSARSMTKSSPVPGIYGLTFWIDSTSAESFATGTSSFINTDNLDDNQAIGRWNNLNPQSTTDLSVTRTTSINQPTYVLNSINNLPAIKFDSAQNQCLFKSSVTGGQMVSSTEATLFVVQKYTGNLTSDLNSVIWLGDGTGTARVINLHSPGGGNVVFDTGDYADNYRVTTTAPTAYNSSPYIISAFRKGTTSKLFFNGATIATVSNGGTSVIDLTTSFTLSIGCIYSGYYHFKGFVGEIIVYNRGLMTEERQAVEQYLGKKWGIKL